MGPEHKRNLCIIEYSRITERKIAPWRSSILRFECILNRKKYNKKQYDQNTNILELEINDLVLIRKETKNGKYDTLYEGPYRVEKLINETTVKIRIGNKSINMHKNRLIKANANYDGNLPPEIVETIDEDEDED